MIYSFEPVVDSRSRILILGSMPGKESLRKHQYYGHAQNTFWRLMGALFNESLSEVYEDRLHMLLRHGIALWDVIKSCERQTSLDAHIKKAVVNDFFAFFSEYRMIKHVFFNGQTAYNTFARHVGFDIDGVSFDCLGSTSPAHAIPFEKRLEDWKSILAYLNYDNGL